ncbi:hypothetical protein EAI_12552 [Harpegnathos saltator]|uniref:Uncharacterized protein n=1 Tax=Harpegnathos saltator TaxID=610380 RepID=E2BDW8_HARSA|nr:hypothetical protein EAI_12552 [Harpegnathos saltator]
MEHLWWLSCPTALLSKEEKEEEVVEEEEEEEEEWWWCSVVVVWCGGAPLHGYLSDTLGRLGGGENDRFSFDDSDRFEEDSLCSFSSEHESLCNNWRGWRRPAAAFGMSKKPFEDAAKLVDCYMLLQQTRRLDSLISGREMADMSYCPEERK